MSDDLEWTDAGPRSRRFDDVYFSAEDGLAETRLVFLEGCGLPEAWRGRERFVVGELGFGSGLNVLALIALWRSARPSPEAQLHVFSVEGFPISREAAARAHAAWPVLVETAEALRAQWPDGRRGFHRIELTRWGVIIDLAVLPVAEALAQWAGRADAWFLDGFAPSRNPEMWTAEVLAAMAARSQPGARAATYTVAGAVRRGLQAAGFSLERRPGFGRKKERVQAVLAGSPDPQRGPETVAVVGGGIAGASLLRAFAALGRASVLVEPEGVGAGASGNPAALVTPRLDAGLGGVARLHAHTFARAVALYRRETPGAVMAEGALQLARGERDLARFARLAAWDGFEPGTLALLDPAGASDALGEPASFALHIRNALTVQPSSVLGTWTSGAPTLPRRVSALTRAGERWRLLDEDGAVLLEADLVCLAAGLGSAGLAGLPPLRAVRGQVSWTELDEMPRAVAWGGYAIPTRTGVLFGATHDRGDFASDVREEDHLRNRRTLAQGRPALAAQIESRPLQGRAGVRAAAPDHLPLAGPVPGAPGLHILAGLGGRGFTLAPLLAEHVAAQALGAPSPLPSDLAPLLDPGRYGVEKPPTP